jgi:hypothetical protein
VPLKHGDTGPLGLRLCTELHTDRVFTASERWGWTEARYLQLPPKKPFAQKFSMDVSRGLFLLVNLNKGRTSYWLKEYALINYAAG